MADKYYLLFDTYGIDYKDFLSREQAMTHLNTMGKQYANQNAIIVDFKSKEIVYVKCVNKYKLYYLIGYAVITDWLKLKSKLKRNYVIYFSNGAASEKEKLQYWTNNDPDEALKFYNSLTEGVECQGKVLIKDGVLDKKSGNQKNYYMSIGAHFG